MTEAQEWQRRLALAKSGGVCEVCGKPLTTPQGAHRIANTEPNRRKWGSLVMDHPDNIAMVCSLSCNQSCNIGYNPRACLELAQRIINKELLKMGGKACQ